MAKITKKNKITKKDIKMLIKAARKGIGDLIEEEAILKIGDTGPIKLDKIKIEIDLDPTNVRNKTDTSPRCRYICVTVGGSRRCYKVCY